MLQFVDAADGVAARCADFLYLCGGMGVGVVLQEGGGAHHALGHHLEGVLGVEAQLDACLGGGLDVSHGVGCAARGQGGGGGQLVFGYEHGGAEGVEEVEHELLLLGVGGHGGDEGHALSDGGGGVGHDAEVGEVGHLCALVFDGQDADDGVDASPGYDGGQHLSVAPGEFHEYVVQHPGFDGQDDDVGVAGGFDVGGGGGEVGDVGLQGVEFAL